MKKLEQQMNCSCYKTPVNLNGAFIKAGSIQQYEELVFDANYSRYVRLYYHDQTNQFLGKP